MNKRIAELELEITALRQDREALYRTQEELSSALHELKVHQEELKTQNQDLRDTRDTLQDLHLKYLDLFDFAPAGYAVLDSNGLIAEVNLTVSELVGQHRATMIGKPFSILLPISERDRFRTFLRAVFTGEIPKRQTLEITYESREQERKEFRFEGLRIGAAPGRPQATCRMVITDITEQRQTQDSLRLSQRIFDDMREGIIVTDRHQRIIRINQSVCEITGYRESEILGQTPRLLSSGKHDAAFYTELWRSLHRRGWWSGEIWNRRKNGDTYVEWLTISSIRSYHDEIEYYVGIFSDISDRKKTEKALQRLAHFDQLTGLPNRVLFLDRLSQAIEIAARHEDTVALLYLDLDWFKRINDTFGHSEGDMILQETAQRLVSCVRTSDTVARLGGDEFVILLASVKRPEDVRPVADAVIRAIEVPFDLQDRRHHLGITVGVALFPSDGTEPETLLRNADAAMYEAKKNGRSGVRFFARDLTDRLHAQMSVEAGLRTALENNELFVVYQPVVQTAGGQPVGLEALVRWRQADGTIAEPESFILAAEESGLILPLGDRVLDLILSQMERWREQNIEMPPLFFNLSPRQFRRMDISKDIVAKIRQRNFDPASFTIEITETSAVENPNRTARLLQEMTRVGIRVAIDDFGAGYTSLKHLIRFPVSLLKIDRSLVSALTTDQRYKIITCAIADVGRSLNMDVVAEGVETEEQLRLVQSCGTRLAQGFYFSEPLAFDAVADYLDGHRHFRLRPAAVAN